MFISLAEHGPAVHDPPPPLHNESAGSADEGVDSDTTDGSRESLELPDCKRLLTRFPGRGMS